MKIDAYATGQTTGQKGDNRTGCAVVLIATNHDGRIQARKMHFALGNSTPNLASLQAVRLAAMALRGGKQRNSTVTIHTDSYYVIEMIIKGENGQYKADPKTNVEAVRSMREQCDLIPELVFAHEKMDTSIGAVCLSLARVAAMSQTDGDSGTTEYANGPDAGLQGEDQGASN